MDASSECLYSEKKHVRTKLKTCSRQHMKIHPLITRPKYDFIGAVREVFVQPSYTTLNKRNMEGGYMRLIKNAGCRAGMDYLRGG
jgi:hypothetical protein